MFVRDPWGIPAMHARAAARRRVILGTAITVATLVVTGWFVWTTHLSAKVELWLHGEQPIQFYLSLDGSLLDDYSRVFAVAHNSGDRLATTREALDHGADVIEIDVISVGDTLYAAHHTPPWFVYEGIYQGPRLDRVWVAAADAEVVKLDLKERSPRYVDLVIAFLNARDDRQVIVTTDHRPTLEALRVSVPHAFRFLSVGTGDHLDALQSDPELSTLIDGVTIRETLLDEESAAWLRESGLMTLAWTVNDVGRMNELVKLGVNGITTDNLAIMQLLGGQERDEKLLARATYRRQD